jgi:transcriptional regulator with XRE-family HTH domain
MNEQKIMIGHKIKAIRELKGFSQDYLATQLNLSQNAISKIEKGEIKLDFNTVCSVADVLETDVNALLNFEPNNIFNNCTQSGVVNTTFNSDQKLIELLLKAKEDIIKDKDRIIELLGNIQNR